jgi:hypothetical protein
MVNLIIGVSWVEEFLPTEFKMFYVSRQKKFSYIVKMWKLQKQTDTTFQSPIE